jgi:hypothetical protein
MEEILHLPERHHEDDSNLSDNQIATAMTQLHQAEDSMLQAMQKVLQIIISPGSIQQLTQYISPRLAERLIPGIEPEDIPVQELFSSCIEGGLSDDYMVIWSIQFFICMIDLRLL